MPEVVGRLRPPRIASAPATPASGECYYDTTANVLYYWNGTVWVAVTAGQSARVYSTTPQTTVSGAFAAMQFDGERFDTDNIHDLTNQGRLTCRTAGKYLIVGSVEWAANATGTRQATIRLNGATTIGSVWQTALAGGLPTKQNVTTIWSLAVNDYAELVVYQDSGPSLNVVVSANWSPEFMMARLV